MNQQDLSLLAQSAAINSTIPEVTEYRRLVDQYSVNFFAVHHGGQGKSEHSVISPLFATREQADEFKARSEDKYPDCFIGHYVSYFTSEHNERRQELLAKIVGVAVESSPYSLLLNEDA
ncbi:MAG: hypothetical protein Q8M94_09595 [Ignavibacteria bacterium]|nr:hypothetical protein [Ignavibacteria bacterium]